MNQVILEGNCGSDAVMRYTQTGYPVANLSIATSKKVKEEVKTTWHKVILLGKTAEMFGPHIKKGSRVHVMGELQNREYTDSQGNKKFITEVLANWCHIVQRLEKQESQAHPAEEPHKYDDIPF